MKQLLKLLTLTVLLMTVNSACRKSSNFKDETSIEKDNEETLTNDVNIIKYPCEDVKILKVFNDEPAIVQRGCFGNVGRVDAFYFVLTNKHSEFFPYTISPVGEIPEQYRTEGLFVYISGNVTSCMVAAECSEPHIKSADMHLFELKSININNSTEKNNKSENLYFPYIYNCGENGLEDPNLPSINYEDNELTGTIAYKRCPIPPEALNPEMSFKGGIQFPQGEAYLFKDSVSEKMITKFKNYWIILFDSKTDITHLFTRLFNMPTGGVICNFPDFAKAWDIPENGCKVYFEGLTYVSSYGGTANQVQFDYVLTNLKRE